MDKLIDPKTIKDVLIAAGWYTENLAFVLGNLELVKAWVLTHTDEFLAGPPVVETQVNPINDTPAIPRYAVEEFYTVEYDIDQGSDLDEIMARWVDLLREADQKLRIQPSPIPPFLIFSSALFNDMRLRSGDAQVFGPSRFMLIEPAIPGVPNAYVFAGRYWAFLDRAIFHFDKKVPLQSRPLSNPYVFTINILQFDNVQ